MAERFLYLLQRSATLHEPGREGMAERMKGHVLQPRALDSGFPGAAEGIPVPDAEDVALAIRHQRRASTASALAQSGTSRGRSLLVRSKRTTPRARSTRSHVSPSTSPWRRPVKAANSTRSASALFLLSLHAVSSFAASAGRTESQRQETRAGAHTCAEP